MHWKADILSALDAEAQKDVWQHEIDLEKINEETRYLNGFVEGHFLHEQAILIQPRVFEGIPGYYVFTPFIVSKTDRAVLVNRGWVPIEQERSERFKIEEPDGILKIAGIMIPNQKPNSFVPQNQPEKNAWYRLNLSQLATHTGLDLLKTHYLNLESKKGTDIFPISAAAEIKISNNHAQYMMFWFTMACALLVIFLIRFVIRFDKAVCG